MTDQPKTKTKTFVDSLDSYYDERAKALIMNINTRGLCVLRHKWINASLYWSKKLEPGIEAHVDISSPKDVLQREWGKGYGGIRYCRRCKKIDCIHNFKESKVYCIGDGISHISYSVSLCCLCDRRILISSCLVYRPTDEAHKLIALVAKRMSILWTGDPQTNGWGSMWYCEFPVEVSRLLIRSPDTAEQYVEAAFAAHDLSIIKK